MNKVDLINSMADKSGLSKADAKKSLEAFMDVIKETMGNGDRVSLVGFGTFSVSNRSARTGINPQTKQPMQIAAKKVVKFKAGSDLAAAV